MPAILAVPTAVLAVVALGLWRSDRRLAREAARLDAAACRLGTLRSAVAELDDQVGRVRDLRDSLAPGRAGSLT